MFSPCKKVCETQSSNGGAFDQKKTEMDGEKVKIVSSTKRIRIHPEAERILGSSCIAVVCLERLTFQIDPNESVFLVNRQPLLSMVTPCTPQIHTEQQGVVIQEEHSQKSLFHQDIEQSTECINVCPRSEHGPAQKEGMELVSTETHALDISVPSVPVTAQAPASGMGQDYESGFEFQDEWDPGMKFESMLDLESELELKSKSDLEPEHDMVLELELESQKSVCDPVCKGYGEWQEGHCSTNHKYLVSMELHGKDKGTEKIEYTNKGEETIEEQEDTTEEGYEQIGGKEDTVKEIREATRGVVKVTEEREEDGKDEEVTETREEGSLERREMESEDFCAVCLNGGELLCCDRCPKVYHLSCHIPVLMFFPLGDWVCTLCRSDQEPQAEYECENTCSFLGVGAPYTLSRTHQRRCEKLTLLLSCHISSAPFQEPVSPIARNYYQIIKRPIDLSVIRKKLNKGNTLHYFTFEQFVDDIMLMFRNCATFNYPDSEVAQAGRDLEAFFLTKIQEVFPDQNFPKANQDRVDRAQLSWRNRKSKKPVLSGKKYYL
ncbi:uncharacterized protein LOC134020565 isoform X1 [Osmerus eperlanus]|uniref:uncharacterized protein LOC134020565 isoform X1 n=2 Tax=Osmerus eperlanus TaxID=29151 RepID=UPI002E11CBE1